MSVADARAAAAHARSLYTPPVDVWASVLGRRLMRCAACSDHAVEVRWRPTRDNPNAPCWCCGSTSHVVPATSR
jgi:hypothetical protein